MKLSGLLVGLVLQYGADHANAYARRHHQAGTTVAKRSTDVCPSGYDPHASGLWSNPAGSGLSPCGGVNPKSCVEDTVNATAALCGQKCTHTPGCVAFEVYQPQPRACFVFVGLQAPFKPDPDCYVCIKAGTPVPPPPPPPPPPQPRPTHGPHSFPRLGNCWGADPYITPKMWNYLGFPNMTSTTWGRYDVQYINPFDSCCWRKEENAWVPLVSAIKKKSPAAVVLATFHATEIWETDVKDGWLPEKCLVRNTNGETCSWWAGLVFTNNLFDADCLDAAVQNALTSLSPLIAAGVDGVFLDGVVDFDIGCSPQTPCNGHCSPTADINCTHAGCPQTPQQPYAVLHAKWLSLYAEWFQRLKAVHPTLAWVNNLALEEAPFLPISNGRMFEGGAGLDVVYGGRSISSFVTEIRKWTTQSLQPSYVTVHMNGNMGGGLWRIGRWQNLVTGGEMMRLMTDFRRMRFGLGVALLTDGYYGYDVGSEMYGAPSYFTEYDADLGQAVDDPVLVHSDGGEVWLREFDRGYVVTSSMRAANHTVVLPVAVRELDLSAEPGMLSGQREAPAWQFVIDNGLGAPGTFGVAGHPDWWASDAARASFKTVQGNWTRVSDQTESHQFGDSFLVGFTEPGGPSGFSQGEPGAFSAGWTFVAPSSGRYHFSTTAVDAHAYPLTDSAVVCVAEAAGGAGCIARSTVDQRAGIRDGRWVRVASDVVLTVNVSYAVSIAWDPSCSGYVAADALLVESDQLYHGNGVLGRAVTVGAMDSRVLLKV